MKPSRKPLTFFLVFIAIASAVLYVSCNKEPNGNTTTKKKCVTCANGGLCINDSCHCPNGFEGFSCEILERTKFTGTWKVKKNGVTGTSNAYISYTSGTPLDQVYINYFDGTGDVDARIAHDSIIIPGQWNYNTYLVGKGYIHDDPVFTDRQAITLAYYTNDTMSHIEKDYGYMSPGTTQPTEWSRF
jgi:hypothetical protein